MSNEVSAIAQKRKAGSPAKKLVLMYLADRASDDGSGVWTSKAHIAADTELSKRTVQNAMNDFEEMGLIEKTGKKPCQHGFTYEYRIDISVLRSLPGTREATGEMSSPHTGEMSSRVQPVHPRGEMSSPHGVQPVHPNHPLTTLEPSNTREARKTKQPDLLEEKPEDILAQKIPIDLARGFVAHRKKLRKPMTTKAAEIMLKKLAAMRDPVAAVEKSIMNGYQGVFEDDRQQPRNHHNGNGVRSSRIEALLRYGQ